MDICFLTLNQMLTMFLFIIFGYLMRKVNVLPSSSYHVMSKLETYFFVPVLTVYNWMNNCTITSLKESSVLVFWGIVLVIVAIIFAYPLSKLFIRNADNAEDKYQRNIYRYAMAFGNSTFMGNYIVLGIWGSEALFKYSMFTLGISFAYNSWGLYTLLPNESGNKHFLKNITKGIITPPFIALFIGLLIGVCDIKKYIPDFVINVLSDGSKCMGPVAMLLAGVVIGSYNLKELLTCKKVYGAAFMRLVFIPACLILILKFIGINKDIIQWALIAFATPIGLNTIVYPGTYGGDVKTGASMTIISHIFSVITIPLMYLVFIVL